MARGFAVAPVMALYDGPEGGARTTAQDIHFPRVVNSSQAAHFVCSLNSVQAGVPVGHKMPDRSAKKEQILIGRSAPCIPMFHVSARSTYIGVFPCAPNERKGEKLRCSGQSLLPQQLGIGKFQTALNSARPKDPCEGATPELIDQSGMTNQGTYGTTFCDIMIR